MDPITQQIALASAGGKKDPLYVDDVFSTFLYEGTGSARTITNGIDNSDKSLVWIKQRNAANSHALQDTVRGKRGIISKSRQIILFFFNITRRWASHPPSEKP